MDGVKVKPFLFPRMGIKCLLCGMEFKSIGYSYEAHAKEHGLRFPKSGNHYLYFNDFNGGRQYYCKVNNGKRIIPIKFEALSKGGKFTPKKIGFGKITKRTFMTSSHWK